MLPLLLHKDVTVLLFCIFLGLGYSARYSTGLNKASKQRIILKGAQTEGWPQTMPAELVGMKICVYQLGSCSKVGL